MKTKTAMGRVLAAGRLERTVAGAAWTRFFVAAVALVVWVSAGFGGIGVDWSNGGGWMVEYGADVNEGPGIAQNNNVIWQLIYAGANGKADEVDLNAPDYLGGDDVLLAVREIPMGGGVASDGTVWDDWLFQMNSGGTLYEDLNWRDEGFVFQRVYQGTPEKGSYYYESKLIAIDTAYAGGAMTPQMFSYDPAGNGVIVDRVIPGWSDPLDQSAQWQGTIGGVTWHWCENGDYDGTTAEVDGANPVAGAVKIPAEVPKREGRWHEVWYDGGDGESHYYSWFEWEQTGFYAVTGIGGLTFYGSTALTSVVIPQGVKYIGRSAFSVCRGLKSVTLPVAVTNIGDSAFSGCSALTNVDLPTGIRLIGEKAFSGCRALKSMTMPSGITNIGANAFFGCDGLKALFVPASWAGTRMLRNAGVPASCRVVYGGGGVEFVEGVEWWYATGNGLASVIAGPTNGTVIILFGRMPGKRHR